MSLSNKTKSILLQVAHKEAVQWIMATEKPDESLVEEKAQVFFEQLAALHEKYDVTGNTDFDGDSDGAVEAPVVTIGGPDGGDYYDYRNLKGKSVNANFPDFKTLDGSKSHWLTKKDGSPTQFAAKNMIPEPVGS